jgi:RNase P/RNase MRP subunit p29
MGISGALDDLTAKTLDLVGSDPAKVIVERIARFELCAVDEERVRPGKRVSGGVIKVAK